MADPAPASRHVLLLQGPRSPFFARLADALAARGAAVSRVLFCPGDALFWRGRPALRYRGALADWPAWLGQTLARLGVTDVAGLGDGRPLHRAGFAVARAAGVRVHVVEQGYLRPGWLTVEPEALSAWRPGPGPAPPAPESAARGAGFATWAAMDMAWDLANLALGWRGYPHYRTHALTHPAAEWAGWARKAALWPLRRAGRARALAAIEAATGPLFLTALQLETDFQIRDRAPHGGMRAALARALDSFAGHAPPGARLIVKPHPLDPQRDDWRGMAARGGAIWLDGGDLAALMPRLAGVVVVNSTVGLAALRAHRPVAVLGEAIYAGLCHRGPLDTFWRAPAAPDPAAVDAFVARLAADIQTPGAFDGPGMAQGAQGAAGLILRRGAA